MDNSSSQALIFMFVRVGRKTYGTLKFVWAVDTWKFISPSNNHILELVNKRITKNTMETTISWMKEAHVTIQIGLSIT